MHSTLGTEAIELPTYHLCTTYQQPRTQALSHARKEEMSLGARLHTSTNVLHSYSGASLCHDFLFVKSHFLSPLYLTCYCFLNVLLTLISRVIETVSLVPRSHPVCVSLPISILKGSTLGLGCGTGSLGRQVVFTTLSLPNCGLTRVVHG